MGASRCQMIELCCFTFLMMDCDLHRDLHRRQTRSGRVQTQLVLLPDADVSEPENEAESDDEHLLLSDDTSDGSVTDSDDDIPLQTLMGNLKKKQSNHHLQTAKSTAHTFRWSKKKAPVPANTEWKGKISEPHEDDETPACYFRRFFCSELQKHIV